MIELLIANLLVLITLNIPDTPLSIAVGKHTSMEACEVLAKKDNFCVGIWEYKEIK